MLSKAESDKIHQEVTLRPMPGKDDRYCAESFRTFVGICIQSARIAGLVFGEYRSAWLVSWRNLAREVRKEDG